MSLQIGLFEITVCLRDFRGQYTHRLDAFLQEPTTLNRFLYEVVYRGALLGKNLFEKKEEGVQSIGVRRW